MSEREGQSPVSPTPPSTAVPRGGFGNTRTIARNSVWIGLQVGFSLLVVFLTSIPIARTFGPEKLGYYNYIQWLASISGVLGSFGIPIATRKYMSEYLGRGEQGLARAVFFSTLRLQTLVGLGITAVAFVVVLIAVLPEYRWIGIFLVAGILPSMVISVPSLANLASEDLSKNVAGIFAGGVTFCVFVGLSLLLDWGLLGIAIGMFVSKLVELVLKMRAALRWINPLPQGLLPPDLKRRMFLFSRDNFVLMLLNIVVWDRSDAVFLKMLNSDTSQVAFFFLAFNIAEKVLSLLKVFTGATGVTMMVQYGRNEDSVRPMMATAARYVALVAVPLLLGVAAISDPLIRLLYGEKFVAAIPVLLVCAVLAIPKAFLEPAQMLLLSSEKQGFIVRWGVVCGAVNVLLDFLLIPPYAAVGAAMANGLAQTMAVLGLWVYATRSSNLQIPYSGLARIGTCGLVMAAVCGLVSRLLHPLPALLIGVLVGAAVFFAMLRLTGSLWQEDRNRLEQLRTLVPKYTVTWFDRLLNLLIPLPPGKTSPVSGGI